MNKPEPQPNPYRSPEDNESDPWTARPKQWLGKTTFFVALFGGAIVFVIASRDAASVQHTRESIPVLSDPVEVELENESIAQAIQNYGRGRGGAHVLMDSGEVLFVDQDGQLKPRSTSDEPASDYGLWGTLGARKDGVR